MGKNPLKAWTMYQGNCRKSWRHCITSDLLEFQFCFQLLLEFCISGLDFLHIVDLKHKLRATFLYFVSWQRLTTTIFGLPFWLQPTYYNHFCRLTSSKPHKSKPRALLWSNSQQATKAPRCITFGNCCLTEPENSKATCPALLGVMTSRIFFHTIRNPGSSPSSSQITRRRLSSICKTPSRIKPLQSLQILIHCQNMKLFYKCLFIHLYCLMFLFLNLHAYKRFIFWKTGIF